MKTNFDENFLYKIYSLLEEIPSGKVTTYGDLAKLSGNKKNARLVGKALKLAGLYGDYPCHRVVNANGRLTPGWHEQKILLIKEHVEIKENGYVNLKKHRWIIE